MSLKVYLFVPTLLIAIGLYGFRSVPITFLFFYGWMGLCSLLNKKVLESLRITKEDVGIGMLSGLIFYGVIFGGIALFQDVIIDRDEIRNLLSEWGFSGVGLGIILLAVNPVLEELYWRGVVFEQIHSSYSLWATIIGTASFYTLYHLLSMVLLFTFPMNLLTILPVFLAGVFWGYVRNRTRSPAGCILSHFFADAGIMSVYWFIIQ